MLGELTQISERDSELLPPPAYFSSAVLTPWSLRGTQWVEEKNLFQFPSSEPAVKSDVSLLSPWSKRSRSFQFTLQLSQLWALSDKYFCTLLIIRQPAREGRVKMRGLLWVFCAWAWKAGIRSAKPNKEPGDSRTCQHLGIPWVPCTGTNIFLSFFSSSLPICLSPLLWQQHNTVSWGRRGPQLCLTSSRCQEGDKEYSETSLCPKGLGKRRKPMALYCPILFLRHWDVRDIQRTCVRTGDCPLDSKPNILITFLPKQSLNCQKTHRTFLWNYNKQKCQGQKYQWVVLYTVSMIGDGGWGGKLHQPPEPLSAAAGLINMYSDIFYGDAD